MKRLLGIFTVLLFFAGPGNLAAQTPDGYILTGVSSTYVTGYGTGMPDMVVYRLDAAGNVVWFNHYGGVFFDDGVTGIETADGGYAVAGTSNSYSYPTLHFLLVKLVESGGVSWRRDYGGAIWQGCRSLRQTADDGYIIGGDTTSYGTYPNDLNMLLYKLDAAGAKQWRKAFGGVGAQWFSTGIQTSDGGYLLVGDNSTYTHGGLDFLVYKLDADGQKQWRKNYGGVNDDGTWLAKEPIGRQAFQCSDGGYVFCGVTFSYTNGDDDFIVYKVDAAGKKQWRKNFGGAGTERAYAIEQTSDGGYIVAGRSSTYNYTGTDYDFLVYKLDAAGNKQWRKNFGGQYNDYCMSAQQTADGGYILAGYGRSYYSGGLGDYDLLVYKLDAAGQKQWRRNYGGFFYETGGDIRETSH
jgi:hypothetical protein